MANAYETGARKIIPAVLIYVENDQGQILMLHRNAKQDDYHEGKYNGLGGKLESDESPRDAAARELAEEAGLVLAPNDFRMLGVLQFPNFKAHKAEDWLVFVFTAKLPGYGTDVQIPWVRGPEGSLVWVARERLLELDLWEGDRHFIPYVSDGRPFSGTIWYEGQRVLRHSVEPF